MSVMVRDHVDAERDARETENRRRWESESARRKRAADALNAWRRTEGLSELPRYVERTVAIPTGQVPVTYELAGGVFADGEFMGEMYEHVSWVPLAVFLDREALGL